MTIFLVNRCFNVFYYLFLLYFYMILFQRTSPSSHTTASVNSLSSHFFPIPPSYTLFYDIQQIFHLHYIYIHIRSEVIQFFTALGETNMTSLIRKLKLC